MNLCSLRRFPIPCHLKSFLILWSCNLSLVVYNFWYAQEFFSLFIKQLADKMVASTLPLPFLAARQAPWADSLRGPNSYQSDLQIAPCPALPWPMKYNPEYTQTSAYSISWEHIPSCCNVLEEIPSWMIPIILTPRRRHHCKAPQIAKPKTFELKPNPLGTEGSHPCKCNTTSNYKPPLLPTGGTDTKK